MSRYIKEVKHEETVIAAGEIHLREKATKSESELAQRRQKIYSAVPMLAELDSLQTRAGAAAASFSMAGDRQNAEEKLKEIKDIASRKALLLAQNGFTSEMLLQQFFCEKCGDKGYLGGEMCSCLKNEINEQRRENIHKMGALRLCRFEDFSLSKYPEQIEETNVFPREVMAQILKDCQNFARDFGKRSPSLFLFGDAGLGKTHLALAMATEVLDKGHDVIYISSQAAFSQISSARYGSDGGLFSAMMRADLLVLDDLGTEYIDAYVLSKLYELVNSRLGKPTIYTSNICKQEQLHQRYTEKISSRLLGECHLMRLWGNDIRLQNK